MIGYKEWSETAESTFTCEFGHCGIRDCYTLPNKTEIYTEFYSPRSIFQKSHYQVIVVLIVKDSKKYRDLAKRYNGELQQTPYGEEGMMGFLFNGKNADEDAFNFAMNERDGILKEFLDKQ